MLDGVRKYKLGERINDAFEVISYKARDPKYPGFPVYLVRHTCGSVSTVYHRRLYEAPRCEVCIYSAMREGLAQNPTTAARREAIRNLDAQAEQARQAKVIPETPVVQAPQPPRQLSQQEKRRIEDERQRNEAAISRTQRIMDGLYD